MNRGAARSGRIEHDGGTSRGALARPAVARKTAA